jgi:peptide/nickel transport system permease protein
MRTSILGYDWGEAVTLDPPASPIPDILTARRPSPRIAQLKRTWYFLSRNTLALVGIGIVLFLILIAVYSFFYSAPDTYMQQFCGQYGGSASCAVCTYPQGQAPPGPNCYPVNPNTPSLIAPTFNPASFSSGPLPLGSLSVDPGRPYFYNIEAGLIKGAPWSLGISAGIVVTGAIIGLLLGAVSGYLGGYVDEVIMRITDVFLSIPALLLILVLLAVLASVVTTLVGRVELLVGAFVITWWPVYARIVRSQVIVTREQKFVEASKASGAKSGRLIARHIIPNSVYPVFVQMSLDVGTIPLLLGSIAFLGFHVFPNQFFPEWGNLSALSIVSIPNLFILCQSSTVGCIFPWWQVLFPGVTVFLFAISVNFVADGLRDALDPRLRR